MGKNCWFCGDVLGSPARRTREHVVPLWLQRELGIGEHVIEPTLTSVPSAEFLRGRKHTVSSLKTGGVCAVCNNGWMSDLETEVQPILLPLIRHERTVASLRRLERTIVSCWAVKTAYMVDVGGLESHVESSHLRDLPHRITRGVHVFARQQRFDQSWYYGSGASWSHPPLDPAAAMLVKRHSYKIALQFGPLMLVVVYWPIAGWNLRVEKGMLRKLWPHASSVVEYVHNAPMQSDTSEAAYLRFTFGISVSPTGRAEGRAYPK